MAMHGNKTHPTDISIYETHRSESRKMGWIWKDEEEDEDQQLNSSSSASHHDIIDFRRSNTPSGERCSTRKIVKTQCRTEEVEPGKFLRKCEKIHEILRDCVGKPVEVVQSNKKYAGDDVTDEVLKGKGESIKLDSSDGVFGAVSRFFEAAEEMKNSFFEVFSKVPPVFSDNEQPSSSIPLRREGPSKPSEKESTHGLSDMAKDI